MHLACRALNGLLATTLTMAALHAASAADALRGVEFTIDNATDHSLACEALAGRWYSFPLGSRPAGGRFVIALSVDPATGTVSMFNSVQVAVPIQTLYCGYDGQAWETRFVFALHKLVRDALPAGHVVLVCTAGVDRPVCL